VDVILCIYVRTMINLLSMGRLIPNGTLHGYVRNDIVRQCWRGGEVCCIVRMVSEEHPFDFLSLHHSTRKLRNNNITKEGMGSLYR
jgi:hypothetical protein